MIDIIYIAFHFPPLNAGGSIRPLKFIRYFREFGINPITLTLDPKDYPHVYEKYSIDAELQNEIPENVEIRHIRSKKLLNINSGKIRNYLNIYFNVTKGNEDRYWKNY